MSLLPIPFHRCHRFVVALLTTCLLAACGGGAGDPSANVGATADAVSRAASVKDSASANTTWVYCASENQVCAFTGTNTVQYGAGSSFVTGTYSNGVTCSNAVFGDPAPGYTKSCSIQSTSSSTPTTPTTPVTPTAPTTPTNTPTTTTNWVACGSENQTCSFTGTRSVRFGVPGLYVIGTYTSQVVCSNTVFGDPAPGYTKACAYAGDTSATTPPTPTTPTIPIPPTTPATPATPSTAAWIFCASENQICAFTGTAAVRFGAGGSFVTANYSNGVACTNAVFGDPAPGYTKSCSYLVPTVALPVITVQPQPIVVSNGQPATFVVTATSGPTATYQWSRNGTAISGATGATYTIRTVQLADSGAVVGVAVTNSGGTTTSNSAALTVTAIVTTGPTAQRPFSDQSLWNARPTQFVLGTASIPTSTYYPLIGNGAYSVAAAIASSTDPAVTVMGPSASQQLFIADAEASAPSITIPHWPANVTPATGTDGEADIIDFANNKIHSFFQLAKGSDGQWRATQYTWTPLNGTGWGTSATYMQGSRAVGVVPIAGLIRINEVHDGLPMYNHALAMSLTSNGLSASPTFVFPATNADGGAATTNTGSIPEGTRVMLPASFDTSTITNVALLKVIQTLKTYGAYVVDRNYGTPYFIYVENGSDFNLMPTGFDNTIAAQEQAIRAAMQPITQVTQWVDATGTIFTPPTNLNLLSMRGYWYVDTGKVGGVFDTMQQAVVFPANGGYTSQINSGGRSVPAFATATPVAGTRFTLRVSATGGASLRLTLTAMGTAFDSGVMHDGDQVVLTWPVGATGAVASVRASSGPQGGGTVSGTMVQLSN